MFRVYPTHSSQKPHTTNGKGRHMLEHDFLKIINESFILLFLKLFKALLLEGSFDGSGNCVLEPWSTD